jgi:hypothetical protein
VRVLGGKRCKLLSVFISIFQAVCLNNKNYIAGFSLMYFAFTLVSFPTIWNVSCLQFLWLDFIPCFEISLSSSFTSMLATVTILRKCILDLCVAVVVTFNYYIEFLSFKLDVEIHQQKLMHASLCMCSYALALRMHFNHSVTLRRKPNDLNVEFSIKFECSTCMFIVCKLVFFQRVQRNNVMLVRRFALFPWLSYHKC